MNEVAIEKIHNEFKDYFKEARLTGSYSLYVPFYKVSLKVDYIYETQLNLLEQFICQCMAKGISSECDISYVLGLPEEAVVFTVNHLENNNYVTRTIEGLGFTEQGQKLFTSNLKREAEQDAVHLYYDGLSPEYKIEFFGKEDDHQFLKYNEIDDTLKGNVILPKTFPQYDKDKDYYSLSKKMIEYLNKQTADGKTQTESSKKVVMIQDFSLENKREVLYHEYRILVFRREDGTFNLLAYDLCGDEFIDQRVTKSLQQLYEENELQTGLVEGDENPGDMSAVIEALKNYATSSDIVLNEEVRSETLQKLELVEKRLETSRYIMNYEIRELFLHYLKSAKESLYIISPWMNSYVVNDNLLNDIKNLLERGVKVSIIYGIFNSNEKMDDRDRKTNKLAEKLKNLGKNYDGLLTIEHGQTHEKLLICDRRHYINGSFNFLSYSGGEDGKFFRNEGSTYSEDPVLIEETIKLRFKESKEA